MPTNVYLPSYHLPVDTPGETGRGRKEAKTMACPTLSVETGRKVVFHSVIKHFLLSLYKKYAIVSGDVRGRRPQ